MVDFRVEPIKPKGVLFDSDKFQAEILQAVRDTAAEGERFVSRYPPQPANSHYRRTGTLGRSWGTQVTKTGLKIEGVIFSNGNIAPYNLTVQGVLQTPQFEARGWKNVQDLNAKLQKEFPARLKAALAKFAKT